MAGVRGVLGPLSAIIGAGLIVYGDASGNSLKTTGTTDYEMIREFFLRTPLRAVDYRVPKANRPCETGY